MKLKKVVGIILSVSLLTAPLCQVVTAEEVFAGTVSKGNMTLSGDDMRILGTVTAKGRYTTLTASDVTFDKKVSCSGGILLEGCTLGSSLKAGGKLTLRGNNTVAARVSARHMVSEAGE